MGTRMSPIYLLAVTLLLIVALMGAVPVRSEVATEAPGDTPLAYLVAWGYNAFEQCDIPAGANYAGVAAGYLHSVAVKTDGSLVAWGWNSDGQCDVPLGNVYAAVAAGYTHSVALKSDGSLAAWGGNWDGETDVPAGSDYVAISAGYYHNLALKSDGSLAAWGDFWMGQCDVPAGNDFKAIAAGNGYSLALKTDGSIAAWGDNWSGQCDVPTGGGYAAIAAGGSHGLALRSDGSLAAWGANWLGQCDVPAGNDFVAVYAGDAHSVAIKSDGSAVAWGNGFQGQLDVPAGHNYLSVAAGGYHCIALAGVPPPKVTSVEPGFGLNNGSVNITSLVGKNFVGGATVKLRKIGESDITATDVVVVSSTQITCTFDIYEATPAEWDVVVTNPGSQSGTLAKGLLIKDGIPPKVTINQAADQADPTNSSTIRFSVVFSEPVVGFDASDVILTSTAGATAASVTDSGDQIHYTVEVTGMSVCGLVSAEIPADVVTDLAGNLGLASTSTDNQVEFDNVAPTVTINLAAGQQDPTGDSVINFTAVFSEPVVGFTGNGVLLSGKAGATTATITGSGTTYNVGVSGMDHAGRVVADLAAGAAHDPAGNSCFASTSTDNEVKFNKSKK